MAEPKWNQYVLGLWTHITGRACIMQTADKRYEISIEGDPYDTAETLSEAMDWVAGWLSADESPTVN